RSDVLWIDDGDEPADSQRCECMVANCQRGLRGITLSPHRSSQPIADFDLGISIDIREQGQPAVANHALTAALDDGPQAISLRGILFMAANNPISNPLRRLDSRTESHHFRIAENGLHRLSIF